MGPKRDNSGKRRRKGGDQWGKNKKKAKKNKASPAVAAPGGSDTEDEVPGPPPVNPEEEQVPAPAAVTAPPSVAGGAVDQFMAAPPPVSEAVAPGAGASVAVPASSSDGVGAAESFPNKKTTAPKPKKTKASEDATATGGVGGVGVGIESQVPADDVPSIQEVPDTLASIDTALTAAGPVQGFGPRRKQKSPIRTLIMNPTAPAAPIDSSSTSPVLGPVSASAPVSPLPGSQDKDERPATGGKCPSIGGKGPSIGDKGPSIGGKRPSTGGKRPVSGGKSTGGKSLSKMTELFRFPSPTSEEEEDEEDADAAGGQPCSSTSTKDAASTIEKKAKDKTQKKHVPLRHGKVKKPSIEGISNNEIKRMARRAGLKRIGGGVYEELRFEAQDFLDELLFKTMVHTEHRQAKTVTTQDVVAGFKSVGGGSWYG